MNPIRSIVRPTNVLLLLVSPHDHTADLLLQMYVIGRLD
jgi:hypothetical protein